MTAVRYRFEVTSLDGTTELPADDAIEIVPETFGQFLVKPTGASNLFALLGLIPLARLQAKRGGSTGVDGLRVQEVYAADDSGTSVDLAYGTVETFTSAALPVPTRAPVSLAAADPVRAARPGWPVWGDSTRLAFLEAVATGTFWNLIVVVQKLPADACCFAGEVAAGPPPP